MMKEKLAQIEKEAREALEKVINKQTLNELKVKYLGKKSEISNVLKDMANLSKEERPVIRKFSKYSETCNRRRNKQKRRRIRKNNIKCQT